MEGAPVSFGWVGLVTLAIETLVIRISGEAARRPKLPLTTRIAVSTLLVIRPAVPIARVGHDCLTRLAARTRLTVPQVGVPRSVASASERVVLPHRANGVGERISLAIGAEVGVQARLTRTLACDKLEIEACCTWRASFGRVVVESASAALCRVADVVADAAPRAVPALVQDGVLGTVLGAPCPDKAHVTTALAG